MNSDDFLDREGLPDCAERSGSVGPDTHYLREVLRLGDTKNIVASSAIYSANKIKLVRKGIRITSSLFDHLVEHKLIPPIEQCLSIEGGVDLPDLEERIILRLKRHPIFQQMDQRLQHDVILSAFRKLPLPNPLAFKLTLARETRPQLFEHSLDVALLAAYLRAHSSHKPSDLSVAAAAGLFHDLGILHIPPEVIPVGQSLDDSARRYLYTHPISSALIVQQNKQLVPEIGVAISEHHERMDGSGYPNGLVGAEISKLGRLLMLADSSAAFLKDSTRVRGSVALRLLRRKFDPVLLEWAHKLFACADTIAVKHTSADLIQLSKKLQVVSEIFSAWETAFRIVSAKDEADHAGPLIDLINRRLSALERTLLESGFVFNQLEEFSGLIENDEFTAIETSELANEAVWQLKEIALEARRHWDEHAHAELHLEVVLGWILAAEKSINSL